MTFSKFIETYKAGHSYSAPDGSYNGECVSLVKRYIKDVLGVTPESIGNAKEYWLKRKSKYIKSLFEPLKDGAQLQRGDVFVRTSGTYGHIGILTKVTSDHIYTIEQNNGGCRVVKHMAYPLKNEFHYLRPLNQSNIIETTDFKSGDKITLKANNVCYKSAKRGDFYTIEEISQFYGTEKARLKKGRTLTVKAVDKVDGDIWVKVTINDKAVYILAYKKDTKKNYIKKA